MQKQHSNHNTCARNALNDYPVEPPQEEYIERRTNSRIHHSLSERIAFNQNALRHEQLENVTPWIRRPFSLGFR